MFCALIVFVLIVANIFSISVFGGNQTNVSADDEFSVWDGTTQQISNNKFNGTGTEADPFLIEDAADLATLSDVVYREVNGYNSSQVHYKLMANLDLQNKDFMSIGYSRSQFKSNFDGNGKTIKNVKALCDRDSASLDIGLFGAVLQAKISNLTIENFKVTNQFINKTAYIGAFAGLATTSTFENCTLKSVTVSAGLYPSKNKSTIYMGGIVGQGSTNAEIKNSSAQNSKFTISDSSSGSIIYAGGLIGHGYGVSIDQSYSNNQNVKITSTSSSIYLGGLAGKLNEKSKLTKSFSNINGASYAISTNNEFYFGGLTGTLESSSIINCYSVSENLSGATGATNYVGGLVGKSVPDPTMLNISDDADFKNQITTSYVVMKISEVEFSDIQCTGALVGCIAPKDGSSEICLSNCFYVFSDDISHDKSGNEIADYNILADRYSEDTNPKKLANADSKRLSSFSKFDKAIWADDTASLNQGYPILRGVGNDEEQTIYEAKIISAGTETLFETLELAFEAVNDNEIISIVTEKLSIEQINIVSKKNIKLTTSCNTTITYEGDPSLAMFVLDGNSSMIICGQTQTDKTFNINIFGQNEIDNTVAGCGNATSINRVFDNYGSLTISNAVQIYGFNCTQSIIDCENNSSLNLNGVYISNNNFDTCINNSGNLSINMADITNNSIADCIIKNYSLLNVSGGNIIGNALADEKSLICNDNGTASIHGGVYTGNTGNIYAIISNGDLELYGSNFNFAPEQPILLDNAKILRYEPATDVKNIQIATKNISNGAVVVDYQNSTTYQDGTTFELVGDSEHFLETSSDKTKIIYAEKQYTIQFSINQEDTFAGNKAIVDGQEFKDGSQCNIAKNSQVNVKIECDSNSIIAEVKIDGVPKSKNEIAQLLLGAYQLTMTHNTEVVVSFKTRKFNLSLSANNGNLTFDDGSTTKQFKITDHPKVSFAPNIGYEYAGQYTIDPTDALRVALTENGLVVSNFISSGEQEIVDVSLLVTYSKKSYKVLFEYDESFGTININGTKISNGDFEMVTYQDDLTIQLLPNANYNLNLLEKIEGQTTTNVTQLVENDMFVLRNVQDETTIRATFGILQYSLQLTTDFKDNQIQFLVYENSSTAPTTSSLFDAGTNLKVQVSLPADSYAFEGYYVKDGQDFALVSQNIEYEFQIYAHTTLFVKLKAYVTARLPVNGTVSIDGVVLQNDLHFACDYEQKIDVLAKPNIGYNFVGWGNNLGFSTAEGQIVVNGPKIVEAHFASKKVNVQISAGSNGTITSQSSSSGNNYVIGDVITLVAEANTGYHFEKYEGTFGEHWENVQNTTYTILAEDAERGTLKFVATFAIDMFDVLITSNEGGKVNPVGLNKIGYGTILSVEVTPSSGFKIESLLVDDVEKKQDIVNNKFTLKVTENHTVAIKFSVISWADFRETPSGLGTKDSPYLITKPEELAFVSFAINTNESAPNGKKDYQYAYYFVVNELDMSGKYFEPIGNDTFSFEGTFDFNFMKIKSIKTQDETKQYQYSKVFDVIGQNGKILNYQKANYTLIIVIASCILIVVLCVVIVIIKETKRRKPKRVFIIPANVVNKDAHLDGTPKINRPDLTKLNKK